MTDRPMVSLSRRRSRTCRAPHSPRRPDAPLTKGRAVSGVVQRLLSGVVRYPGPGNASRPQGHPLTPRRARAAISLFFPGVDWSPGPGDQPAPRDMHVTTAVFVTAPRPARFRVPALLMTATNRDNGDDDEQFNQGERPPACSTASTCTSKSLADRRRNCSRPAPASPPPPSAIVSAAPAPSRPNASPGRRRVRSSPPRRCRHRSHCAPQTCQAALLQRADGSEGMSVARIIADLGGDEDFAPAQVAEAIQYRSLDRKFWSA